MAITRIRGGQIHDRTIDGVKILQGSLLDEHIASNASISESKLNIDWAAHTEILENKKVVDYVQVNNTDVSGVSEIDATALVGIPNTDLGVTSDPLNGEGIIIDSPKNRVPLRDSVTGDPVLDDHGHEVYGRVTKDDVTGAFKVGFFTDEAGVETPFTMPTDQHIDWQYARRFNLLTVNEMFAANEKFVEGAADASAHLNIEQLAKDLYGPVHTLDRDGNANLPTSLVQQIADEIARATQAETNLQTNIDGEAAARIAADNSIIDDLSSTATDKGAHLIGISNAKFKTQTVAEVLEELSDRLTITEGAGKDIDAEVEASRSSTAKATDYTDLDSRLEAIEQDQINDAKELTGYKQTNDDRVTDVETSISEAFDRAAASANGYFPVQTFTSLKERFEDIELQTDLGLKKATESNTEITDARGTMATLDERLDVSLNEDGTLKAGKQIHTHKKHISQITVNASVVNMPAGETFVTDGTLNVYVNGILQANGINFTNMLDADGKGIGVDFGADQVLTGDIVILEWVSYNAQ